MKALIIRFYLTLIIVLALFSCRNSGKDKETISTEIIENPVTANDTANTGNLPKFKFDTESFDFGPIIQGERVMHTFKFKNVGGSNLVISAATASCGCTVPKYSDTPVRPGESGEIEVLFNSENREGMQHKTVTVRANTQPARIELSFTANIIVPNK